MTVSHLTPPPPGYLFGGRHRAACRGSAALKAYVHAGLDKRCSGCPSVSSQCLGTNVKTRLHLVQQRKKPIKPIFQYAFRQLFRPLLTPFLLTGNSSDACKSLQIYNFLLSPSRIKKEDMQTAQHTKSQRRGRGNRHAGAERPKEEPDLSALLCKCAYMCLI